MDEKAIMMSPESYVNTLSTVQQLRAAKRELISQIEAYESDKGEDWDYKPSPHTVYTLNLEYLAAVCCKLADLEKERIFNT